MVDENFAGEFEIFLNHELKIYIEVGYLKKKKQITTIT